MASVDLVEKANFTRLSRLLIDKGTKALRNILDGIHPPANLPAVLNANRATLLKLKPRVINDTQWNLLFPPSGNPPDSETFDVTLLTVLLRNFSGLPSPATGWNVMPPDTDNSVEANIARIKLFRNQVYGHVTSTRVERTTFDNLWNKISKALVDLKIPQGEIDDLKICSLGPEEEICGQLLKEWFLQEEKHKIMLDHLTREVSTVHSDLLDIKSVLQQMDVEVKRNVSLEDQSLQKFAKHNFNSIIKRKIKFFLPGTREWLLEKINKWFEGKDEKESRLFLLTAGPGFGKSVFAAKVCEIFKEKGRLAACHFCDFNNSNLKDPMMMLESLACQMCESIDGFKEKLVDQLKRTHTIRSLKDAFQIYLQNPLDELDVERSLIVIDGLDESATSDKSDMVKLVADYFPDLPECVKVLMTSRPELSVQGLENIEKIEIKINHEKNELDILQYLKVFLPNLSARDAMIDVEHADQYDVFYGEMLPEIVRKCEGSFLYAFHVQHELRKRKDLDIISFQEVMSFLPKGVGSVYQAYFHRLEEELEAVMHRNPELFKLLELLVAIDTEESALPLKFLPRALDLDLDCRRTKKIINDVNEAVSCLLYISDDLITVFHKSVYDWLLADGYDDHEYTVKVSDGKKRLWLVCKHVFEEIKTNVSSGKEVKFTSDVTHALKYGHNYLLYCGLKDSFSWLVDIVIIYVILSVYPKRIYSLNDVFQNVLRSDVDLSAQLRRRITWHLAEISYLKNHEALRKGKYKYALPTSYLEAIVDYSPQGCFTDNERKIAEMVLAKYPRCVHHKSVAMTPLHPLFTKPLGPDLITAIGISSNKKLAAVAVACKAISVFALPNLVKLWEFLPVRRDWPRFCCTFSPDDTYILYGRLEEALDIGKKKERTFFEGTNERFNCCAFSSSGKRLITNDGSETIKLWDIVRCSLVSVLSAGVQVDKCTFSSTGHFIMGYARCAKKEAYCVWDAITLQRIDQRTRFCGIKRRRKDGVLRTEKCNRCFQPDCKEFTTSKWLDIASSMHLIRYMPHSSMSLLHGMSEKICVISTGIYRGVECVFYLDREQSLHVMKNIHFTTIAAWEIVINKSGSCMDPLHTGITAINDEHWLYQDENQLVVLRSVHTKENQLNAPTPTRVLCCSFSPDGSQLATCTSDGLMKIWNVNTSRVCQRFRNSLETKSAACWWADKYLYVCHVIESIPNLSRYPVDKTLKINVTQRQPMSLCAVQNVFLQFSGFLDFSEGFLSVERGETKPVKVLDIRKRGDPQSVMLPGIEPMMSIAVSCRAYFVLGKGYLGYFLWKKKNAQPSAYDVFVCFEFPVTQPMPMPYKRCPPVCCFSEDSSFAVFLFETVLQQGFTLIDTDTGIHATDTNQLDDSPTWHSKISKLFCTNTAVILLTANLIEIYDFKTWKRLEWSLQPYLTIDLLIHSKLSPKENVLAVPRITGDIEFLQLCIPKNTVESNAQKNVERLGGILRPPFMCRRITRLEKEDPVKCWNLSAPARLGEKTTVKRDSVKCTTLPGPGTLPNIPNIKKDLVKRCTLPGPGRFGNIPKVKKDSVKSSNLPGPGKFGKIPRVKKPDYVKSSTLPGPGKVGDIPKVRRDSVRNLTFPDPVHLPTIVYHNL